MWCLPLVWFSLIMNRGGKTRPVRGESLFVLHFFVGRDMVLGLLSLMVLGLKGSMHAGFSHPHFFTGRSKVLDLHSPICLAPPRLIFSWAFTGHTYPFGTPNNNSSQKFPTKQTQLQHRLTFFLFKDLYWIN